MLTLNMTLFYNHFEMINMLRPFILYAWKLMDFSQSSKGLIIGQYSHNMQGNAKEVLGFTK